MAFNIVPGQEEATRRLRAVLRSGRMPHAYLFQGAPGTGRLATARELARVLLCGRPPEPDHYCGRCVDCRLFDDANHPDYLETGVPEDRQQFPIKTVRDVIQPKAALKPVRGGRRVFIVRDAERMTIEAANCFLKTLEEPPGACVFVLIAASLRNIPETILSRCRLVRFPNLPPDRLQADLQADGVPAKQARWLARRCWGSPGLARLCHDRGMAEFNSELTDRLASMSLADNFTLSDRLARAASEGKGSASEIRERLQDLLECAALYYRDLAVVAASGDPEQVCNSPAQKLVEASRGKDPDEFLSRAELVLATMDRIEANTNRQLALDDLFTQLAHSARGNGRP